MGTIYDKDNIKLSLFDRSQHHGHNISHIHANDHGERVEGNTYYGHYETQTVYGYRADDGTWFDDCGACCDYCEQNHLGWADAEKTIQVWVWDR